MSILTTDQLKIEALKINLSELIEPQEISIETSYIIGADISVSVASMIARSTFVEDYSYIIFTENKFKLPVGNNFIDVYINIAAAILIDEQHKAIKVRHFDWDNGYPIAVNIINDISSIVDDETIEHEASAYVLENSLKLDDLFWSKMEEAINSAFNQHYDDVVVC